MEFNHTNNVIAASYLTCKSRAYNIIFLNRLLKPILMML